MLQTIKKNSSWLRKQLINKYMGIEERFLWWVGESKNRLERLRHHFINGRNFRNASKVGLTRREIWLAYRNWFGTLLIYVAELCGIGEFYQTVMDIFKFNTRPLSSRELELAQGVFGDSISYELVRLDNRAILGTKSGKVAYVSFHTVNSWGKMLDWVLIHELTHVWQYERMGAVYMPRALAAQHTAEGYNYGGLKALQENARIGLKAFNLEQQADIVADYFLLSNSETPQWARNAKPNDLQWYEPYLKEIRSAGEGA